MARGRRRSVFIIKSCWELPIKLCLFYEYFAEKWTDAEPIVEVDGVIVNLILENDE